MMWRTCVVTRAVDRKAVMGHGTIRKTHDNKGFNDVNDVRE